MRIVTTGFLAALALAAWAAPALAGDDDKKAAAPAAACTEGETRCDGKYAGKVKKGNNPPAGARVMVCKAGKWKVQTSCNRAKSMGCYVIDDPAASGPVARCVSALAGGE